MPSDNSNPQGGGNNTASGGGNDKPVRILNFRGTGEHDAQDLATSSTTYVPKPSLTSERVSYTISYPGSDVIAPDVTAEEFSKTFPDFISNAVNGHLEALQKNKSKG